MSVVETVLPREVRKLSKQLLEQQQAIEEKDTTLTILGDDLDVERQDNRLKAQEITVLEQTNHDLIATRHVPRRGGYDTVLVVIEKNKTDEHGKSGKHPYYMIRCKNLHIPRQDEISRHGC